MEESALTRTRRSRRGVTLLEVLIVIGIVVALAAILLPAIAHAREVSRRVACLSNVHRLTQAVLAYAADNDGCLPNAAASNDPVLSPLCPRNNGAPPGSPAPHGTVVLPSIAACLLPYGISDPQMWRCPSAPPTGMNAFVLSGDDPYGGISAPNQFTPNYHYLADKEWFAQAIVNGPVTKQTRLRVWATRNVSGVRVGRLAPRTGASAIVLFHDLDATYHSEGVPLSADSTVRYSIYTNPNDWHYYANFGFLDGHAEGRSFANVDGYLANIHGPIRQAWWGVDFATTFPEQYPLN